MLEINFLITCTSTWHTFYQKIKLLLFLYRCPELSYNNLHYLIVCILLLLYSLNLLLPNYRGELLYYVQQVIYIYRWKETLAKHQQNHFRLHCSSAPLCVFTKGCTCKIDDVSQHYTCLNVSYSLETVNNEMMAKNTDSALQYSCIYIM